MPLGLLLLAVGAAATIAPGGVFYPDGATTLHFAFEGSPNGDRPVVRPPAMYHADDGFGFVDSPGLIGTARGVTAPRYFRFDVNLPAGNYDVGVTLGGTREESITTIKAEGHRPMVLDAHVSAGQTAMRSFTVNVRHGEGDALDADGRLTLEFAGTNPSLMKLDIKPNTQAATVFVVGDAMAADHEEILAAGWGQMLPILFKPGEVAVANDAAPGDSAEKLIADKRLESIVRTMKEGDTLLIAFGGESAKDVSLDAAKWKSSMQACIDEARKHKATPALVMPLAGASGQSGQLMVELARDQKVPLIDLNAKASAFLEKLGPARSAAVGGNGQLSAYGAYELAALIAQGLQEQHLELAGHLASEPVTNADPSQFPANLGYEYLKKP
jgi:lysophospholipase L1-like esterase